MIKSISSTDLRAQAAKVLNDVSYGQSLYVIEKHGQPSAAIINMQDFRLLQQIKESAEADEFFTMLETIRQRADSVSPGELAELIEEARADYWASVPIPQQEGGA